MDDVSRRGFLKVLPAAALVPSFASPVQQDGSASVTEAFPYQDPILVREIVGASHGNVARVKELVGERPALARASWDWGYGDWETALGAASHVGNKEIAAILLANGAHPTIFSAAMLGHLDAVKAFIAAAPGIQRTRGPHGITLLEHAKAGKSDDVVKFLEALGDADQEHPTEPLGEGDPEALLGTYTYGTTGRMIVGRNTRGLTLLREGTTERNLFHHGGRVFNPAGAEAVRITFEPSQGRATAIRIVDGSVQVRATR